MVMIEAVICFFVLCCFSVIHMSRFQWAEKHMMTETTTNQTPLIQNLEGETSLFHCKKSYVIKCSQLILYSQYYVYDFVYCGIL